MTVRVGVRRVGTSHYSAHIRIPVRLNNWFRSVLALVCTSRKSYRFNSSVGQNLRYSWGRACYLWNCSDSVIFWTALIKQSPGLNEIMVLLWNPLYACNVNIRTLFFEQRLLFFHFHSRSKYVLIAPAHGIITPQAWSCHPLLKNPSHFLFVLPKIMCKRTLGSFSLWELPTIGK